MSTRMQNLIENMGGVVRVEAKPFAPLSREIMSKYLDVDKKEFSDYVEACKFHPCYHEHEPICGIKEALANHKIFESRYDAYTIIRKDIQNQRKRF